MCTHLIKAMCTMRITLKYMCKFRHITICLYLKDDCFSNVFSALTAALYTSLVGKNQFNALPDSQNAVSSAKRFVTIMSRKQSMDAFNQDGIIPVSIVLFTSGISTECIFLWYEGPSL